METQIHTVYMFCFFLSTHTLGDVGCYPKHENCSHKGKSDLFKQKPVGTFFSAAISSLVRNDQINKVFQNVSNISERSFPCILFLK